MSMTRTLQITLTEELRACGDGNPWTKFIGTVEIAGVPHHLEAWQVYLNSEGIQQAVDPDECWYDLIADNMIEGAGRTVTIDGREYIMVLTPYQE